MSGTPDSLALVYTGAWYCLAVLFSYYLVMAFVFRWRTGRDSGATKYEPPRNISPALTAYLIESGRCERAFAAAIVSLAGKGYLEIQQKKDWFVLEKLREVDKSLPLEEASILNTLFSPSSAKTYAFSARDCMRLSVTYDKFKDVIGSIAEPEFISAHTGTRLMGVAFSLVIALAVIVSSAVFENGYSVGSIAISGIWILIGGSCFVAAVRVWPGTIRKLASLLPGSGRPRRPLNLNDMIPIFLTCSALLGFLFLAFLTSTNFALFVTVLVLLNALFWNFLEAPTRAGRKVLTDLGGFREFLSRADADRLNRENEPGKAPNVFEKYSAYAVALDVEHSWGEEFTEGLIELIQMDQAYGRGMEIPLSADNRIIELKIDRRK